MAENYQQQIKNYAPETTGSFPLRPIQRWLLNTHLNKVNSTMMNISAFYKLDDSIDLEKAVKAVNDTVAAHDVFKCRFVFNEEVYAC